MDAIDLVREHFASLGVKKLEVPEWKITVFAAPVTLAEKNRLYRKSKDNDMELLVDLVVMKAQDENGKKLFEADHRATLLNKADPNVVARVAHWILSGEGPSSEELKN